MVFAGPDAAQLLNSVFVMVRETTRLLGNADRNQLAVFGLLKVGLAWRDDSLREEFKGMRPGLAAWELANVPGQAPGTINVTGAILDRFPNEFQSRFGDSNGNCRQGKMFARPKITHGAPQGI